MKHSRTTSGLLVLMLALGTPPAARATVAVTITADNGYAFGFGDINGVTSTITGIENCNAGEIANCGGPETYSIPGSVDLSTTYIYIAAWSDDRTHQGVLASFTDGTTVVNSGLVNGGAGPQWEVYATGEQMDISCVADGCLPLSPAGPPSMFGMNGHIAVANSGTLWQGASSGFLALGDTNDGTGTVYGQICTSVMPANAQWMWRNPDPVNITDPFTVGGAMSCAASQGQEYLIFRVGPIGPILDGPPSDTHCLFNSLAKKTAFKSSMVRSFAECPSITYPSSNTRTRSGADACKPVVPTETGSGSTSYEYGGSSSCTVSITPSVRNCATYVTSWFNTPPLGLPAETCQVTRIKLRCSGIFQSDGITPIDDTDDGWTLSSLLRFTLDDQVGGDMTVIDLPVSIDLPIDPPGSLRLDRSLQEFLLPIFGATGAALPSCTTIRIVDLRIVDPEGLPFAEIGVSTR